MRQSLENLRVLLTVGFFQGQNAAAVVEALVFVEGMITRVDAEAKAAADIAAATAAPTPPAAMEPPPRRERKRR